MWQNKLISTQELVTQKLVRPNWYACNWYDINWCAVIGTPFIGSIEVQHTSNNPPLLFMQMKTPNLKIRTKICFRRRKVWSKM